MVAERTTPCVVRVRPRPGGGHLEPVAGRRGPLAGVSRPAAPETLAVGGAPEPTSEVFAARQCAPPWPCRPLFVRLGCAA